MDQGTRARWANHAGFTELRRWIWPHRLSATRTRTKSSLSRSPISSEKKRWLSNSTRSCSELGDSLIARIADAIVVDDFLIAAGNPLEPTHGQRFVNAVRTTGRRSGSGSKPARQPRRSAAALFPVR